MRERSISFLLSINCDAEPMFWARSVIPLQKSFGELLKKRIKYTYMPCVVISFRISLNKFCYFAGTISGDKLAFVFVRNDIVLL